MNDIYNHRACVDSIVFAYNTVNPVVTVTYTGTGDNARQLQAGARIVIVTTDDNVPYSFTVGGESNSGQFTLRDSGMRETTFTSPSPIPNADLYLMGIDYEIPGLSTGSQYFVRVKAENAAGVCPMIAGCGVSMLTNPSSAIPRGASDPPEAVTATTVDSASVQVNWTAPYSVGPIVSYRVDAYTRSVLASTNTASFFGDQEVQIFSTSPNSNTTGTFTLAYGAYTKQLEGTVSGLNSFLVFDTTTDLTPYLEPGDTILVDGYVYTIAAFQYPSPTQIFVMEKITASILNTDVKNKIIMVKPKTYPISASATAEAVEAAIQTEGSFGQVHVER